MGMGSKGKRDGPEPKMRQQKQGSKQSCQAPMIIVSVWKRLAIALPFILTLHFYRPDGATCVLIFRFLDAAIVIWLIL